MLVDFQMAGCNATLGFYAWQCMLLWAFEKNEQSKKVVVAFVVSANVALNFF